MGKGVRLRRQRAVWRQQTARWQQWRLWGLHGGGCLSLALRLHRLQRLADLPGARSQVWLLLPQLAE